MAMKALPTCACLAIRGVKMMFMWRIWRRLMMVMIVPLDHSALLGQMMMMMIVLIMIVMTMIVMTMRTLPTCALFGKKRCEDGVYVENLEMLMMIHSALLDRMMTMMMMILIMIVMTLTAYPVLCLARRGVKMVITAVAVIPQRKTRFPPYLHF